MCRYDCAHEHRQDARTPEQLLDRFTKVRLREDTSQSERPKAGDAHGVSAQLIR